MGRARERDRTRRAEYAQGRRGVKRAIIASQTEKEIEAERERGVRGVSCPTSPVIRESAFKWLFHRLFPIQLN